MKIVVITNAERKLELLAQGITDAAELLWVEEPGAVAEATGYIDLLFDGSAERIKQLKSLQPALIIVNAVITTINELPPGFVRINGWNSFLQRPLVEAAGPAIDQEKTAALFSSFNKTIEWVPDTPGFITARVISMIINEAYFTLEEKVSRKDEIDTAMKLGTNYPFGPFEWAAKIGVQHVNTLLTTLAKSNSRYTPSTLLQQEAQLA